MDLGLCLRTPLQRVFLTVLVIVTCARGVLAECLVPPPPCTALEKTGIVFVGDVTSAGRTVATPQPSGAMLKLCTARTAAS